MKTLKRTHKDRFEGNGEGAVTGSLLFQSVPQRRSLRLLQNAVASDQISYSVLDHLQ